jgi:hypothetical protein
MLLNDLCVQVFYATRNAREKGNTNLRSLTVLRQGTGGFMNDTAIYRKTQFRCFTTAACVLALLTFVAPSSFAQPLDIHLLSYNNSFWADQDLNVDQDPYFPIAFPTTPNEQSHVYYVAQSDSQHIHQLFYNGVSWENQDLTALSGGPTSSGGPIAGFSVGNYQYVYYSSRSSHVHQLLYNNVNWTDTDISAKSETQALASFGANIIAFTTTPALHVYYLDTNNDIRQLFSPDGTKWQDENLTNFNDPSKNVSLSTGFNIGNLQYLYWVDGDGGDTHQLSYNNSVWSDTDITKLIKTPFFGVGAALVIPGTQKIRLYSVNLNNGHILQLASPNNGKWSVTDLTQKSKSPVGVFGSTLLIAFATTPNNGLHVFYTYKGQIYQIYQNTPSTWTFGNITQQGNGVLSDGALVGYAVQNLQYVFYQTQ